MTILVKKSKNTNTSAPEKEKSSKAKKTIPDSNTESPTNSIPSSLFQKSVGLNDARHFVPSSLPSSSMRALGGIIRKNSFILLMTAIIKRESIGVAHSIKAPAIKRKAKWKTVLLLHLQSAPQIHAKNEVGKSQNIPICPRRCTSRACNISSINLALSKAVRATVLWHGALVRRLGWPQCRSPAPIPPGQARSPVEAPGLSDPDVYTFGFVSAINDYTSIFERLVVHICECASKVTLPLEANPSRTTDGMYLNKVDITRC